VWDGIAQNVVRRYKPIARSTVVTTVSIVAMGEIGVPPRRWVSSGGWAILSNGNRNSGQQECCRKADPC
jgi:hypothetical protein